MVLIGYGIWHAGWHSWLPNSADQVEVWVGNRYIFAGSALSLAAAAWLHLRGNTVWGINLCRTARDSGGLGHDEFPLRPERDLAAVVAFPMALAGIAEVIRTRDRRQRE